MEISAKKKVNSLKQGKNLNYLTDQGCHINSARSFATK